MAYYLRTHSYVRLIHTPTTPPTTTPTTPPTTTPTSPTRATPNQVYIVANHAHIAEHPIDAPSHSGNPFKLSQPPNYGVTFKLVDGIMHVYNAKVTRGQEMGSTPGSGNGLGLIPRVSNFTCWGLVIFRICFCEIKMGHRRYKI